MALVGGLRRSEQEDVRGNLLDPVERFGAQKIGRGKILPAEPLFKGVKLATLPGRRADSADELGRDAESAGNFAHEAGGTGSGAG